MSKIEILIGSNRKPKIDGVKNGVKKVCNHFNLKFRNIIFKIIEAESGVSETPLCLEELQIGAMNRAKNIFKKKNNLETISIGLEGGIFVVENRAFLQSWCAVYNGKQFYFGSSGAIELPEIIKTKIILEKQSLSKVIDEYAGKKNIRSGEGTWGILSDNIITRKDSFTLASTIALVSYFRSQNQK